MLAVIRSALSLKSAWRIRIIALGSIVILLGVGSQVLVNAVAADAGLPTLQVTAYTSQQKMADGASPYVGACAVSTNQFPLGTVLALYNSDGSFNRQCTAEDTRSTITPDQIALALPGDLIGAKQWGTRYLSVQVLRLGWGEGNPPKPALPLVPTAPHYLLKPLRSHFRV